MYCIIGNRMIIVNSKFKIFVFFSFIKKEEVRAKTDKPIAPTLYVPYNSDPSDKFGFNKLIILISFVISALREDKSDIIVGRSKTPDNIIAIITGINRRIV